MGRGERGDGERRGKKCAEDEINLAREITLKDIKIMLLNRFYTTCE